MPLVCTLFFPSSDWTSWTALYHTLYCSFYGWTTIQSNEATETGGAMSLYNLGDRYTRKCSQYALLDGRAHI